MPFIAPMAAAAGPMIAGASGAASTLGPLISLGGGVMQAFGKKSEYDQAAKISDYNSRVYAENANLIERAAAQQKEVNQKKKKSYLGRMRAGYAANGLELEGSPLLALAAAAANLELDIQNEEFNSMVDASRARSQSGIYSMERDYYKKAGTINMAGGIIAAGANFASKY